MQASGQLLLFKVVAKAENMSVARAANPGAFLLRLKSAARMCHTEAVLSRMANMTTKVISKAKAMTRQHEPYFYDEYMADMNKTWTNDESINENETKRTVTYTVGTKYLSSATGKGVIMVTSLLFSATRRAKCSPRESL